MYIIGMLFLSEWIICTLIPYRPPPTFHVNVDVYAFNWLDFPKYNASNDPFYKIMQMLSVPVPVNTTWEINVVVLPEFESESEFEFTPAFHPTPHWIGNPHLVEPESEKPNKSKRAPKRPQMHHQNVSVSRKKGEARSFPYMRKR